MAAPHVSGVAALVGSAWRPCWPTRSASGHDCSSTGATARGHGGQDRDGPTRQRAPGDRSTKPVVAAADRFGVNIGTVIGDASARSMPAGPPRRTGLGGLVELRRSAARPAGSRCRRSATTAEGSSTLQSDRTFGTTFGVRARTAPGTPGGRSARPRSARRSIRAGHRWPRMGALDSVESSTAVDRLPEHELDRRADGDVRLHRPIGGDRRAARGRLAAA